MLKPQDEVDKKLAKIYANQQTNNLDISSKIDPELIWKAMSLAGLNNKLFLVVKNLRAST
ncbi:MAG: hypothetical protein V2B14_01485 [bacterium]